MKVTQATVETFLDNHGDKMDASDEVKISRALRSLLRLKRDKTNLNTSLKDEGRQMFLITKIAQYQAELENLQQGAERISEMEAEIDMAQNTLNTIFGEVKGSYDF